MGTEPRAVFWHIGIFGILASMMRRILVRFAREQGAAKRGGQTVRVSLSEAIFVEAQDSDTDLVAVDEALTKLAELDERQARIVELLFFWRPES